MLIGNEEPRHLKKDVALEVAAQLNEEDDDGWEYWVAPSMQPGLYNVRVYDKDYNFLGEL
jgi:hypothetical protein